MTSVIKHIAHPEPTAVWQARMDHAHLTNQDLVEPPYWYLDESTGRTYHDIYGCIGWPTEVSDRDHGLPGYVGIVGVIRPSSLKKKEAYDPRDANFMLLDEAQSADVPQLIKKCLELRDKWGFGCQPDLLTAFLGDPERFVTTLALANERIMEKGTERDALLIAPPDDFYIPNIFDTYVRSLQSSIAKGQTRFLFGGHTILRDCITEFRKDDPAVMSAGGLVHSLLNRCMWMAQVRKTMFSVEEAI